VKTDFETAHEIDYVWPCYVRL